MKRIIGLLAALWVIGASLGLGETFDLTPFMYEENVVIPVDRRTVLIAESDNTAHHVKLIQDGMFIRGLTLDKREDRLSFVIGDEGNIGLITRPELAGGQAGQAYWRWNADNTLADPVKLDDGAGYFYACGNGFYGAQRVGEGREVFVCDADGQVLFSRFYTPKGDERIAPMDVVPDVDGSYLLAVSKEVLTNDEDLILIERVDAEGNVLWQTEFPGSYGHEGCVLTGDGMGGAYLAKTDDHNYKLAQLYHVDAFGKLEWVRQIEAEGLILSIFCGEYDRTAGGLVLNSKVVSKSKGVYRVVRLVIGEHGTLTASWAKDFSSRPDYSFTILRGVDGSLYTSSGANYLDTKNTKQVLVPVSALPEADVPTIIIR